MFKCNYELIRNNFFIFTNKGKNIILLKLSLFKSADIAIVMTIVFVLIN